MNEERCSAVRVYDAELLTKDPPFVSHLEKLMEQDLFDELIKFLPAGEAKIVMLSKVKEVRFSLDETELRQDITIRDLVFCKDCKYWITEGNMSMCSQQFFYGRADNWFCANGERRETECKP